MDKLPTEIIYKISSFMDVRSMMKLSEVNKNINKKITQDWNILCKIYYKNFTKHEKNFIDKKNFVKCYQTLCVNCCRPTNNINLFYNERVCLVCQSIDSKYCSFSKTECKNIYNLKEKELSEIPCIYHKKKYLFLRSDIIKFIKRANLSNAISTRKYKKYVNLERKTTMASFKINFINIFLFFNYNIKLSYFSLHVDRYNGEAILSKYVKDLKNDQKLTKDLVKCYLEIDFLVKNNFDLNSIKRNEFYNYLIYCLIFNNNIDSTITNDYILDIVNKIKVEQSDIFYRNSLFKKLFKNFDPFVVEPYIYKGGDFLKYIEIYNEYIFINKYLNMNNLYTISLNFSIDLKKLIAISLQKLSDKVGFKFIPIYLIKKYSIVF